MMQAQRKRSARPASVAAPRPDYIAAVRFADGRRDLFCVRNALSVADARELVALEVGDFVSILIAPRS